MKTINILLILVSVALSSISQILLKKGMMSQSVQYAMHGGDGVEIFKSIAFSIYILLGLALFALSAVFWIFVLSRTPLYIAYPFIALGIVATILAGGVVFGEPVSWQAIGGVFFIVLGVALVGMSA